MARDRATRLRLRGGSRTRKRLRFGYDVAGDETAMARILVADDNEDICELLRVMLSATGHEVVVAPDGASALALLRARPVDLLITDIFMPGKEGLETIMELRRDFPSVKIVAMSGGGKLGELQYLEDAVQLGAVRSILKPFREAEILAVVREALAS